MHEIVPFCTSISNMFMTSPPTQTPIFNTFS
jgi:hypothetical protein